jgi:hypothetical protein
MVTLSQTSLVGYTRVKIHRHPGSRNPSRSYRQQYQAHQSEIADNPLSKCGQFRESTPLDAQPPGVVPVDFSILLWVK